MGLLNVLTGGLIGSSPLGNAVGGAAQISQGMQGPPGQPIPQQDLLQLLQQLQAQGQQQQMPMPQLSSQQPPRI